METQMVTAEVYREEMQIHAELTIGSESITTIATFSQDIGRPIAINADSEFVQLLFRVAEKLRELHILEMIINPHPDLPVDSAPAEDVK